MDHTNHWYGHAHILARWCGLDATNPPPIRGVVQHGWTFVHGYGYKHDADPSLTRLVWSDVCRRRGQAIGWRDFYAMGSPFAYLLEMEPEPAPAREGTIWYPFHGTREYEGVHGSHDALIDEIKATEDGPVTVCLYYVEYEDSSVRRHYEDAGFRVICHGSRGIWWKGTDTQFLYRQLAELKRHKRVASNRLSTAIFYGIAAGCDAGVYGDPMEFAGGAAGFNGEQLLEAWFPGLHGKHLDMDAARAIARRELGQDLVAPPDELIRVLGWKESWLTSSN